MGMDNLYMFYANKDDEEVVTNVKNDKNVTNVTNVTTVDILKPRESFSL